MGTVAKRVGAVLGVAAGVAVALAALEGLGAQASCTLGILAWAIVWWVLGVLPEFVTALIMAVLFMAVAGIPAGTVFLPFSESTWWLLFAAFGLGLGMKESGLVGRIARAVLRAFPPRFESQVLALMAAGTVTGPLIPSMTAKLAVLTPFALGISDSMGYERKGRQAGGLFLAALVGVRNIGPAVISASVIGYALLALYPQDVQQQFNMVTWFLSGLPWFAVVSVLNYLAIVALYRPRGTGQGKQGKVRQGSAPRADGADGASAEVSAGGLNGVGGASAEGSAGGLNGVAAPAPAAGPTASAPAATASASAPAAGSTASAPAATASISAPANPDAGERAPMGTREKKMLAIIVATVALWVLEPVTGIPAVAAALGGMMACLAFGVFDAKAMRSGMNWESLIFIGIVMGLASVFAYTGVDEWVVGVCSPVLMQLAFSPYAFVLGVAAITVLLRFVIASEMAFVSIFMAFLMPMAASLGINPWVVGFAVYALVNPWFALYQNPVYLAAFYSVDGKMVRHADMAKYCVLYVAICMAGLAVSVPFWQMLGYIAM